ncbi:putative serine threonine-protein kinase [Erysiphe neolycopersici]|uniref:non-specific serine/threonine protein kinase n=1 Tax=Erysiphe neolycopersici TaxID=212602 RepID=A0A420HWL7_9PEZI|nr:putative serine threonine-protein kinase [Erysiphe neolycopersici]
MAPFNPVAHPTASRPIYGVSVPLSDSQAPAGTFAPGTKIQVGSQKVVILKYFSEGGFAHVYLVKMPKPIDGTDIAILKRVAVPDKEHLASMRTEVETMKKLKGHRHIVTYYDSHASQLKGGGYEVFLLMEFCNGGGLINFMNTRLQNRLTEPEILNIFSDVAEGVACMHYLKPPLLHRDLKVENILITTKEGSRKFKLCDFGSTAPPQPAGSTSAECRTIEEDIQKHTTLQYRSPEMIDVYRKLPIDEKSDIWALGVLLYKLCFYTTPFEAQGQLAILNASFTFPDYPHFSDRLKLLIASMLRESPKSRPNIYQVLREACLMQGIEVPIKDIYTGKDPFELGKNLMEVKEQIPLPVGAVFTTPSVQQTKIPEIIPMRRGRPPGPSLGQIQKSNSSPRAVTNDPWAALDSIPQAIIDEVSTRFPSLDQFSLLHDGGIYDFDKTSSDTTQDISKRVTEILADDAFAIQNKQPISKAQEIISKNPELQAASSAAVYQPPLISTNNFRQTPSSYVSQGTMTSTPITNNVALNFSSISPSKHCCTPDLSKNHDPDTLIKQTSNISFLRENEHCNRDASQILSYLRSDTEISSSDSDSDSDSDGQIELIDLKSSNSLLGQTENEQKRENQRQRLSESKSRCNNISCLPGTKKLLTGKFGDAFKRFENNNSFQNLPKNSRTPSPSDMIEREIFDSQSVRNSNILSDGIAEFHTLKGESIFDNNTEGLPPEQRREIERLRLCIEEMRVADAADEYRKKLANRGNSGDAAPKNISRATIIQNKVQSLLDENQGKSQNFKKTAIGYGKYTQPELK